jgi:hypothetical protein
MVPNASTASAGQSSAMPSQLSARSRVPTAARHRVVGAYGRATPTGEKTQNGRSPKASSTKLPQISRRHLRDLQMSTALGNPEGRVSLHSASY